MDDEGELDAGQRARVRRLWSLVYSRLQPTPRSRAVSSTDHRHALCIFSFPNNGSSVVTRKTLQQTSQPEQTLAARGQRRRDGAPPALALA